MDVQSRHLSSHQLKAQEYIQEIAVRKRPEALTTIKAILARAKVSQNVFDTALKNLQSQAKVVLHFHPERLSLTGQSVAMGLLQEGVYKTQFETGLSSGSPTAFPGGDRDLWERRLFGDAYHSDDASLSDRPKYGSLDIMRHPDGPSPRFGSCYFVLRTSVSKRSTFTFGGSQEDDSLERTGSLPAMETVMAALLREVERGQGALGVGDLTVTSLVAQFTDGLSSPLSDLSERPLGRALDSFIEAQVHGPINLEDDVEQLVADPSFQGGPLEEILLAISKKYDFPLYSTGIRASRFQLMRSLILSEDLKSNS